MPQTVSVQVGRVSTRDGAKLHLALGGLARCGAGTGRILDPARALTTTDRSDLCKRCLPHIRTAVADALDEVRYACRYDRPAEARLERIAETLQTDAERAEVDELAARYWADTVTAAQTVMALPVDQRADAWTVARRRDQIRLVPAA